MAEGIAFAHEHGVKVYVTVNILAHNGDLPGVREYLQELRELKPDALIIADPGVFDRSHSDVLSGDGDVISVHRRTTRTMEPISSGIDSARSAS